MNSNKAKLQQLGDAHRQATYAGDLAADLGLTSAPVTVPRSKRRWVLPLVVGTSSGLAAAMMVAVLAAVVIKHAIDRRIEEAQQLRNQLVGLQMPAPSYSDMPGLSFPSLTMDTSTGHTPSLSELPVSMSMPSFSWPTAIDVGPSDVPLTQDLNTKENS